MKIQPIEIKRYVAERMDISIDLLTFQVRNKQAVHGRAVCAYLMKKCTSLSLKQIGMQLGGRDHSTIINLLRRIEDGKYYFTSDWPFVEKIINDGIELFGNKTEEQRIKANIKLIAQVRKLNNLDVIEAARLLTV